MEVIRKCIHPVTDSCEVCESPDEHYRRIMQGPNPPVLYLPGYWAVLRSAR
jgi:hypothetical protein